MFVRSSCGIALVVAVCLGVRATAQVPPSPDLRALSLRSLQAGRTVRITGRDIGTRTGSFAAVRDGALWFQDQPADRSVPLAGIDSVWVSRGHTGTGALVGGLIGSVVGLVRRFGQVLPSG